jgi:hypothetical protein
MTQKINTQRNTNDNQVTETKDKQKLNISWSRNNKRDGTKFTGTVNSKHGKTYFYIKKVIGGFSYSLYLGDSIVLHKDSDVNYLKELAKGYI